ncbi:hypothetical protein DFJ58DRAFT_802186, partial [Suillus subalutaceus]|uniref:uncharacterized protein n=1 Tax=Suillus subalutaceus TaxID=48586 RepID=UPI001B8691BA
RFPVFFCKGNIGDTRSKLSQKSAGSSNIVSCFLIFGILYHISQIMRLSFILVVVAAFNFTVSTPVDDEPSRGHKYSYQPDRRQEA